MKAVAGPNGERRNRLFRLSNGQKIRESENVIEERH